MNEEIRNNVANDSQSPQDSKQAAQKVSKEKTFKTLKRSNNKPFFRKRNVKQVEGIKQVPINMKLLKPRLTGQYTLIKNVPCIIKSFVGSVRISIKPEFELMRDTLGVYFSNHVDFDFNKLRLLKVELGITSDSKRSDVINALSNRYIEWTVALANYFVSNVTEHKHLVLHDLLGDRTLPVMFIRFISLYRNINRVRSIPQTTNQVYTELEEVKFPNEVMTHKGKLEQGSREILAIKTPIEFSRYLQTCLEINKIINPDYNIQFNLERHQTALDCLLSCKIIRDKTISVQHSEQLPTEKEICDTFMYGIDYTISKIPNSYIGDMIYELPEGYERYLATRFWELSMQTSDVAITTIVEKYGTFNREESEIITGPTQVQLVDSGDGSHR